MVPLSLACVADALNLPDYTNGLDECVGRLQRRLPFRMPSLELYIFLAALLNAVSS